MAERFQHDVVDSTQTSAVALARQGYGAGTVVVARSQRNGIGRLDRVWNSPPGGLYLSMISDLPESSSRLLPLSIAVELRMALSPLSATGLRVKWPNDLVVDAPTPVPRKLSGILVDRIARSAGPDLAVVGVGVNVRRSPVPLAQEIAERAVFLEELGDSVPTLEQLESTVVRSIGVATNRLSAPEGDRGVIEECRRHLYGVGRPVRVDGSEVGILRSLEDDGSLLVEQDGTLTSYQAGDLAVGVHA